MNSPNETVEWVNRAEEDYQLARLSLRRRTPLTYGATFHAQQCAEKYLKAVLSAGHIAFPRTHDLAALYILCQKNGIILPVSEDNLEKLTAFAVQVRYPGAQPTLVPGHRSARSQTDPALLRPENVDRGDVWRFQKTWL